MNKLTFLAVESDQNIGNTLASWIIVWCYLPCHKLSKAHAPKKASCTSESSKPNKTVPTAGYGRLIGRRSADLRHCCEGRPWIRSQDVV